MRGTHDNFVIGIIIRINDYFRKYKSTILGVPYQLWIVWTEFSIIFRCKTTQSVKVEVLNKDCLV